MPLPFQPIHILEATLVAKTAGATKNPPHPVPWWAACEGSYGVGKRLG